MATTILIVGTSPDRSFSRWLPRVGVLSLVMLAFFAPRLFLEDDALPPVSELVVYDDAPSAFGRLAIPEHDGAAPVVVLIHGGFWRRQGGDLSLMQPLADDLVSRGWAVWNIEYGRTGERFGGWPHTFDHVESAIRQLAVLRSRHPGRLDLDDVTVVGHSAGGHLALWAGGLGGTARIDRVIGLAPVASLEAAASSSLGNGAVQDLLGGEPDEVPDRYRFATPRPAPDVDVLVVTGDADDIVEPRFAEFEASSAVERRSIPGADHLALIDPDGDAWREVVSWLEVRE